MKALLRVIGGVLSGLIVLLIVRRITGLNPGERVPGLWLTGDLNTSPVTDWSFAGQRSNRECSDEVLVSAPSFRNHLAVAYNDQLYLATTGGGVRSWPLNKGPRSPCAPVRIENQLYDRTLSVVTDPGRKCRRAPAAGEKIRSTVPAAGGVNFTVYRVMPG